MACNELEDKTKAEADRSVPNGLHNILPITIGLVVLDTAKSAQ